MGGYQGWPYKGGFNGTIRSVDGQEIYSGPASFAALRGETEAECAANAQLIAAAPDLLEALAQLCENAELARFHIGNTEDGDIIASALWDTIGQARAAISRATGQ